MSIIPVNHQAVAHFFTGSGLPRGAAVTYGTITSGSHTPETAALDLHDLFADTLMPKLSSGVSLASTRVKYGPNATGPFAVAGGAVPGARAGSGMPPSLAFLVEKNTGLGGKSGHGRFYLPGMLEADAGSDGVLDSTVRTNLQIAVAAFLDGVETLFGNMVLFHNASSDPTNVTSLTVDALAATQRRRMRR